MGRKKISDFCDIHSGKRCFIIGNGPSLKKADLLRLENEITFAGNEIYRIPDFSPTYYSIDTIADMNIEKIVNLKCKYKFITKRLFPFGRFNNVVLFRSIERMPYPFMPNFSLDCERCLYSGGTLTHINLQLATYMGCTSIYIIGQDWFDKLDYGNFVGKHFYGDGGVKRTFTTWDERIKLKKQNLTMKSDSELLKKMGVKVYNLTKGTKLKAFEVKDFDKVLSM